MTPTAIDASVLTKLYFDEEHSNRARLTVSRAEQLIAPDLILAEVANVAWKRVQRREIDSNTAVSIIEQVLRFPITLVPTSVVLSDATNIALESKCTIYDSLYIAAAIRQSTALTTADRRFARLIQATQWSTFITWIGE